MFKNIIVLGDSNTGKSSLITRYCDDTFDPQHLNSPGFPLARFRTFGVNASESNASIILREFSSAMKNDQRQRDTYREFLRDEKTLVFLTFDITNPQSFENIKDWIELFNLDNVPAKVVLLGTKTDRMLPSDDRVPESSIQRFLKMRPYITYFAVSSKTKESLEALFDHVKQFFYPNLTLSDQTYDHSDSDIIADERSDNLDLHHAPISKEVIALKRYESRRQDDTRSYSHFYGHFFGQSRATKLAATKALIDVLQGKADSLDRKHLKALTHGELGKIVKEQNIKLNHYLGGSKGRCFI